MRFLCDVHISYKLVTHIETLGFEAIHINQILDKSETKDSDICKYADENNMIVVTKDADFRNSFFIKGTPKKLIKINLGNISNQMLVEIFSKRITTFQDLNKKDSFLLEIGRENIQLTELK
jgi:predicted nuclease of predicted toxin-antitoxin system